MYIFVSVSVVTRGRLHVMEFTVKHLSPHQALSQHIIHCLLLFVIIFRSSLLHILHCKLSFNILGCYLAAVLYSVTHLTGLSVTVSFIISWIIS